MTNNFHLISIIGVKKPNLYYKNKKLLGNLWYNFKSINCILNFL